MGSQGTGKTTDNGEKEMKNRLSQVTYCKSVKRVLLLLAICHMSYAIMGCGYSTRSMISSKFKTIYVRPFVNKIDITKETNVAVKYKIYKPILETDITNKVINRFLYDGNLRPTKEETADLILKAELIEFRRDPLRYTDTDEVEEYRLNLITNISLWDNKENKLIWEEKNFVGDTTYFTTGSLAKSEDTAILGAIEDLARRIVERTVEEW